MRISERGYGEEGRERLTLVPENVDDLWHLAHVLEPGDLVEGDTTRRIQRNDDQMRDTGGQREHLFVTLEVDRKSTRLNSSHRSLSRMPSSA